MRRRDVRISPKRRPHQTARVALLALAVIFLSGCALHLKHAKRYYSEGQQWSRAFKTEKAVASYKRALLEAEDEIRKNPSAQAFMLKGLAEASLERWTEAEESFLNASHYGFSEGEAWASDVSRLGLASSLAETGLENAALRSLGSLLDKSSFKPVRLEAARKYIDLSLSGALKQEEKERAATLAALAKTAEKLVDGDYACGFNHYLLSQIESHRKDYRKSFEEAVVGRELGLPTEKIFRDNDLQIIFCGRKLKEILPAEEWRDFEAVYGRWVKKWEWKDALTPDWKKD